MRTRSFLAVAATAVALWNSTGTAAPLPAPFWSVEGDGRISHVFNTNAPMVLCMQGLRVVMQVECDHDAGLRYQARFFNVPPNNISKKKIIFHAGPDTLPGVTIDGQAHDIVAPTSAVFDGMLTLTYPEPDLVFTRTLYPSTENALVLEVWQVHNRTDKPVTVAVEPARKTVPAAENVDIVWQSRGLAPVAVTPGKQAEFYLSAQAQVHGDAELPVDPAAEFAARKALTEAAWRGPGRLETPEPLLDAAFALQKFHVLECPIETWKGIITHNGSLTYSPGIWANDPVEYSSPLFPFFGNDLLNRAAINMYRVWLDHIRVNGINPFPGSFEHTALKLVQRDRGDDAMVLYGLSHFLLFLGDRETAESLWPLIEYSADSVRRHTTEDGIVASKTDEMEGRYPTGDANLSTSSLAYGGYSLAACLGRVLGKPQAAEFEAHATTLRKSIETYFGAQVQGFETYRYYRGNTTLRGWILLPLAMGITERREATVAALTSDKLWPGRMQGNDILAESTRPTEWGRETYYALRVLFKAGYTEKALDLTRRVVQAQIFGKNGPYPDEDAIDMLCPGSLYPRIFTEGLFDIEPTGLDAFTCTPHLPQAWPRMALRDLRAFGRTWDLIVERVGDRQRVTVRAGGRILLEESGPAGKTYSVTFDPANTPPTMKPSDHRP